MEASVSELVADLEVNHPAEAVAAVLLDISRLPEWNPALLEAFTSETRALAGQSFDVATPLPGKATLRYDEVSPHRIVWELRGPGGLEVGEWLMNPVGDGTWVTHRMHHSGAVFALLQRPMRQVPGWRLDRLALRLRQD